MNAEVDALLRDAVAHHQSGRLADAQAIYEQILRADERNPNALNLLGMIHHARGRFEHAAELVARAIDVAPKAAGFHNNWGSFVWRSGGANRRSGRCGKLSRCSRITSRRSTISAWH